jgi:hypothetical protein
MAGVVPGFPADRFRAGIRLAMTLGAPPDAADAPTFVFPRQVSNIAPADELGIPFDPAARPTPAPLRMVQVPCAVEYQDAEGTLENIGVVTPSRITITLLDEDHAQVRGFEYVLLGGDRYFYRRTEPPLGMDTVGVWIIHCVAEDET